jgi:hypothetical protein
MYRRLTTIALLAAAVAVIAATPASASRSCGSVQEYHVTVTRGSVSCAKARTVAKEWETSKGVTHRFPAYTLWYFAFPGGWDCSTLNMGHVGCARDGLGSLKNGFTYEATRNAHERIALLAA